MIDLTNRIIEKAFENKYDKANKPYIEHLRRVAENCHQYFNDKKINQDLQIIALLHDILEDCSEWNEKALRQIFNNKIVDSIVILTHDINTDYFSYIRKIKESNNKYCVAIKIADLKDNMDVTRLESLTQKDLERIHKYHKAYKMLTT